MFFVFIFFLQSVMMIEQIKNMEMISQDIVLRNMDVYVKELFLVMVKDI